VEGVLKRVHFSKQRNLADSVPQARPSYVKKARRLGHREERRGGRGDG